MCQKTVVPGELSLPSAPFTLSIPPCRRLHSDAQPSPLSFWPVVEHGADR